MNTTQDDGGPAFPESASGPYPNGEVVVGRPGMSLRDWFAGMALSGLMQNGQFAPAEIGASAVLFADATLAALRRKEAK